MDYFGIICKTIEEIENNIDKEINIQSLAQMNYLSPFHFHRIFKAFTGHSLIYYARKRKLNKASYDLVYTNRKIIEIAFDYGYESSEAFSRALKKESNFSPSTVRKDKICNIGIEKLSLFTANYENKYSGEAFSYSIIDLKPFVLAGVHANMTLENEKNYVDINKIYLKLKNLRKTLENDLIDELREHHFGIAYSNNLDLKNPYAYEFSYYRAYEIKDIKHFPSSIITKKIDWCKCAKFNVGSSFHDHQKALYYIFGHWLPKSNYQLNRETFDFMEEIIENPHGEIEIYFYIPIK